ncbi:MAG: ComEC/Rec2 family competence protein [Ruminococcaceae bacterium]|nr:ComEC/Rec2 family competence protein [Oscillospiraceae bacterium]
MKRTFAVIGASALFSLCAFRFVNIKAIKAVFIIAFIAFFVFLLFKKIRKDGTLPITTVTVCCCCVLFCAYDKSVHGKIDVFSDREQTHSISGEIVSLPTYDNGRVYYIVRTDTIDGNNNNLKIRLSFDKKLNASPFDRIEGDFHLYRLGSFSSEIEDYYSSKGLFLGGYTFEDEKVKIGGQSGFHPMYYVLCAKQKILDSVSLNIPNEYGGLLTGLLIGEKGQINEKTLNSFSLIGSYHLLAVSGLHVTVWAGFVYGLFGLFRLKRKLKSILCILFILFFMALTGFNPPVVRAGTLLIFVFLGNLFEREADSLNSIGFAVTLMLIINPYAALSKSLWLSVFASVGIIILYPKIYERLNKGSFENKTVEYIKAFVLQSLSVSLSVVIFTLPLTVLFFERFSLLSVISNLLLIEISSAAMILTGFAVLFFLIGVSFISYPLFFVAQFLSKAITEIARLLSSIPFSTVSADFLPLKITAFALPVAVALIYYLKKKDKIKLSKITAWAVACSFVTVCIFGLVEGKNRRRIYFPAVGNGTSVVLVDSNKASVIGCGGNYFAYSSVCGIMKREGVKNLELVFVPSERKYVYSFFDGILNGFDIFSVKQSEFGKAILSDGTEIECEKNFSFIKNGNLTVLIVFNPDFNMDYLPEEYSSADYLLTRERTPVNFKKENFKSVIISAEDGENDGCFYYNNGKTLYLEVKQNGRARLETAD